MKGISKIKNQNFIRLKSAIEDKLSIKLSDDAFKEIMLKYIEIVSPRAYCLTTKEFKILKLRLNQFTLERIGKIYFVTKENIRQGEAKAIRKLLHPSRMKMLLKEMEEDK